MRIACCITKAQKHIVKTWYLLFLRLNTDYMSAPQYYVYTRIAYLVTVEAIHVWYNRPWFTKPGMLKLGN